MRALHRVPRAESEPLVFATCRGRYAVELRLTMRPTCDASKPSSMKYSKRRATCHVRYHEGLLGELFYSAMYRAPAACSILLRDAMHDDVDLACMLANAEPDGRHFIDSDSAMDVPRFDLWLISAFDDDQCRVDWHAPCAPSATN